MTLLYSNSIRNLMIGRGILAAMTTLTAITVYKGTQPTAAQITSSWASYNSASSDYLVHYPGAGWTQPLNGILLSLTTVPPAVNSVGTGIATWCIVWMTNVSQATVDSTTLPNTQFIVGPCSDFIGDGIVRFADPQLTAGVSKVILEGSIGATF